MKAGLDKYNLADNLLNKPILTKDGFVTAFSKFHSLEVKFYWITNFIYHINKLVIYPHLIKKSNFTSDKSLIKVINGVAIPSEYMEYEREFLPESQIRLIAYLNTDFIPFVNKEYEKLIDIMREELRGSGFDKGFYDDKLVTFNYNSLAISEFLDRVVLNPHKQAIYLRKMLIRLSIDINSNVITETRMNRIINADMTNFEHMADIVNIRLKIGNDDAESSDYNIVTELSEGRDAEKHKETISDYTITDKNKLICLGTERKLKKLYELLIEYDVIEGDNDDINYDDFLSLCLKSDKSNYVKDAVPRKLRLKGDQLLLTYVFGNLKNSKGNRKYLFDGANFWNKLSNLFLTKEGNKLNGRSLSKQFSRVNGGKKPFYGKENMDLIINMVRAVS